MILKLDGRLISVLWVPNFINTSGGCEFKCLWTFQPYFCGHNRFCNKYGSQKALQQAKSHIEQWYPVVGILEMHKETYEVMENEMPHFFKGLSKLGRWELIVDFISKNAKIIISASGTVKNKGILRQEISKEATIVLKGRLVEEYELYNFAQQRLQKQYKKIQ